MTTIQDTIDTATDSVCREFWQQLNALLLECVKLGPGYAVVAPNSGSEPVHRPDMPWTPETFTGFVFEFPAPYITTEVKALTARNAIVYTQPEMSAHERLELIAKAEAALLVEAAEGVSP